MTTRDGRKLINFLTLPNSSTAEDETLPPLIAYIHGGPSTRDFLQFDPWVHNFFLTYQAKFVHFKKFCLTKMLIFFSIFWVLFFFFRFF